MMFPERLSRSYPIGQEARKRLRTVGIGLVIILALVSILLGIAILTPNETVGVAGKQNSLGWILFIFGVIVITYLAGDD